MWTILNKDIFSWTKEYDGPRFHALLCDPPYYLDTIKKRFGNMDSDTKGVVAERIQDRSNSFGRLASGFLGQDWDTDIALDPETWKQLGTHLHPGALGMAYSHARTYHQMAMAIEMAGFIIYPLIGWINAQGFPHPTRIDEYEGYYYNRNALKGAIEPICVFQKPYEGTMKENILEFGTGLWNIEGGRIKGEPVPINKLEEWSGFGEHKKPKYKATVNDKGRWPANVIGSADLKLPFDQFFFQAKPSRKEKDAGLEDLEYTDKYISSGSAGFGNHNPVCKVCGLDKYDRGRGVCECDNPDWKKPKNKQVKNDHPTVKPIDLNKHLATLLLPPDDFKPRRILNPFSGSGSEMIGSVLAGWDEVIGIEIDKEYCIVAEKRLHEAER
jgi:site-specific DNA-methyltransferase (adenine-specific)